MVNGIKLGKDAKLVCDCRLNTFDTVLNHFDEIHFNSYRTSEYAYKNTEIINDIIQKIFDMIATTLAPDGDIIMKDKGEIVFIARNTTNGIYFDDNNIRFKIDYNSGDIIRFRKVFDTIEIKTMYN